MAVASMFALGLFMIQTSAATCNDEFALFQVSKPRVSQVHIQGLGNLKRQPRPDPVPTVNRITEHDLWGIRDLVLAGYGAVMMERETEGLKAVQNASVALARLLPELHPSAPCREQISNVISQRDASGGDDKALILSVAQTCYECLGVDPNNFDHPFVEEGLEDRSIMLSGRFVTINDESKLGACRDSGWARTCSYWVALHTMAYRADALGLSDKFLGNVFQVIAGGALFCGGCTLHFRSMHESFLLPSVQKNLGQIF